MKDVPFTIQLCTILILQFIIHSESYLTCIRGYTEQDIYFLYTTAPPYHGKFVQTVQVFQ